MDEEYISRQAAQKVADDCSDEHRYAKDSRWPETYSPYHEGWTDACDTIFARLESVPTADVRPVIDGNWIPVTNGRGGHECSRCHQYAPSYQSGSEYLSRFCPACGCYMGEG